MAGSRKGVVYRGTGKNITGRVKSREFERNIFCSQLDYWHGSFSLVCCEMKYGNFSGRFLLGIVGHNMGDY